LSIAAVTWCAALGVWTFTQVSVSAGDASSSATGLFIEVLNKYLYFYSAGNQVRASHASAVRFHGFVLDLQGAATAPCV
jgi:hypothetical protein